MKIAIYLTTLISCVLAHAGSYDLQLLDKASVKDLSALAKLGANDREYSGLEAFSPVRLYEDLARADLQALPEDKVAEALKAVGKLSGRGIHTLLKKELKLNLSEAKPEGWSMQDGLKSLVQGFDATYAGWRTMPVIDLLLRIEREDKRPLVTQALKNAWTDIASALVEVRDRTSPLQGKVIHDSALKNLQKMGDLDAASALVQILDDNPSDREALQALALIAYRTHPSGMLKACEIIMGLRPSTLL